MWVPKPTLWAWLLNYYYVDITVVFRPEGRKVSVMEDRVVEVVWFYKHSKNAICNCSHRLGLWAVLSINAKIRLTSKSWNTPWKSVAWFPTFPPPLPPLASLVSCHTKLLPETGRLERPSYKTSALCLLLSYLQVNTYGSESLSRIKAMVIFPFCKKPKISAESQNCWVHHFCMSYSSTELLPPLPNLETCILTFIPTFSQNRKPHRFL